MFKLPVFLSSLLEITVRELVELRTSSLCQESGALELNFCSVAVTFFKKWCLSFAPTKELKEKVKTPNAKK
ncbi:hypothetical protein HPSA50_0955 [Helicobacter pylori SouthAfrica50]|uniref:Uncharacterized protein n=1 Tax=Helicobacter pylori SouthAfrica50 TaxID=1352357 RepID=T2S8M3_HELPX|nr:hypothetical protein HPSA50_0955 [Helicobacter pylori SouthAfrica50]